MPLKAVSGGMEFGKVLVLGWVLQSTLGASVVTNGSLRLARHSRIGSPKLLPGFLFMQGESDGLAQGLGLKVGGGTGSAIPFEPDDSCDSEVFAGASRDLRSPQLPYLKLDTWGCERQPANLSAILIENDMLRVTLTPQFGGKIWSMYDKTADREFFFKNPAHQPANIGARGAWTAGGLEFNWSPGFLGHSAFTEDRVWVGKLQTDLVSLYNCDGNGTGEMVRVWEFDRYNGTVYQVDVLLHGSELWTHVKVTNPNDFDVNGYWWTCAAHRASPDTRILAPASIVTVETFVGAPLRNAPWPQMDNGLLNSTFAGVESPTRCVDSSVLGNIAYTGDYFLRIPQTRRKWIAHTTLGDDYVAMHGHSLNGSKFFTWGQSGPGRFMQDFLAGGAERAGDYTELQSGITPTQQQVFTLAANSSISFTEYFKPLRMNLSSSYDDAVDQLDTAWQTEVPAARVAQMEQFFLRHEDTPPTEILSHGSDWGFLHQKLLGRQFAAGAPFQRSKLAESELWNELVETGGFSEETLKDTVPLAYAVDPLWVHTLQQSAKVNSTWLHKLLLAVAAAESGQLGQPRQLLLAALEQHRSPLILRCLAVLAQDPEETWAHFVAAWDLSVTLNGTAHGQLRVNLADEMLQFLMGLVPSWSSHTVDPDNVWFVRLTKFSAAAASRVGKDISDTVLVARILLMSIEGAFDEALDILGKQCFPTLGRGRDVLITLWKKCVEGKAARALKQQLSPQQAHHARKSSPVPRNIGCPYATLYCDQYW